MQRSREVLDAGLAAILESPRDEGVLRLIVRRPAAGEREVLQEGQLDSVLGLVGDNWSVRHPSPHPDTQLNIMNARVIALVAGDPDRWSLAGDQLFLDLDLSLENAPPGTRLAIGSAIIEMTEEPHTGCGKFAARYGVDATKFVNSPTGRRLRLRGACAKVVQSGIIRVNDVVRKLPGALP